MPKKKICEICSGRRWLLTVADNVLIAVHGKSIMKSEWQLPEIERCDNCCSDKFTDDMAQRAFLKDVLAGRAKLPRYLLLWGGHC
jgi:hypothetical protein